MKENDNLREEVINAELAEKTCVTCGSVLTKKSRGRKRIYCSEKCRSKHYHDTHDTVPLTDEDKYFAGKYITAKALLTDFAPVTIVRVDEEEFEDKRRKGAKVMKPLLYFAQFERPLILNKTNYLDIAELMDTKVMSGWLNRPGVIALERKLVQTPEGKKLGIRIARDNTGAS
jgi:endogenous inhibitor of DNA gyrase (YacG/DUF329 family)